MAVTIEEQELQKQHAAALLELQKQRAAAAAKLAKIDAQLAEVEDTNFRERLGTMPVSSMTTREKVETINRIGSDAFAELVVAGRR